MGAWKCDVCGRFAKMTAPNSRRLVSVDSHFSKEEYETRCDAPLCRDQPSTPGDAPQLKPWPLPRTYVSDVDDDPEWVCEWIVGTQGGGWQRRFMLCTGGSEPPYIIACSEHVSMLQEHPSADLVRAGIRWVSEAAPHSDEAFPEVIQ